MHRLGKLASFASLLAIGAITLRPQPAETRQETQFAGGVVFNDLNRNGRRDPGEPGLGGVRVSNQVDVVRTDRRGNWRLPVVGDTIFFVVKPRGWMTPVTDDQLPRFFYIHKPGGSPTGTKFPGLEPTGPLPPSIDFPLHAQEEPRKFQALFFGDPQPRDKREVEYIAHDIVEPLVGRHSARFGVTLGDIAFDNLSTFEPLNQTIALLGIPWYNVIGNHDLNFEAKEDRYSDETFERVYGPNFYSFDHGPVHFVVLDNVEWSRHAETNLGRYVGKFGSAQLAWLKKDLELIPKDQLVVLMMHIPIPNTEDRQELYRLIEPRPYVLSVAAHTHYQQHHFIDAKDGWNAPKPHHHVVNVTTSGSWWQGAPDETGIPHTTMRDGAPNGYAIFTFDGNQYSIEFRAARRPASYQMEIHAPETVERIQAQDVEVLVNVFGGSERSKVEMRFGERGQWMPMAKVERRDPKYEAVFERDKALASPFRPLPGPINSPHIWALRLPAMPLRGVQPIHVRTTDMFGQTYLATRAIEIE